MSRCRARPPEPACMRGPRGGACQGPGAAGLQAGLPPGAVPSHTDAHSALWPVRWDRGYDPCSAFLADKKMMSPASATGTPQIYPQGSPFPPGHSGKAFRYVPWRGRWGKDAPAREAWVPALGSVRPALPTSVGGYRSAGPGPAEGPGGCGSALCVLGGCHGCMVSVTVYRV